jgi:hypothetical protein
MVSYLARNHAYLLPHEPRQYILEERQVEVCFLDFELGVAGVQGKGGGLGFARFYGAGEEVEGEELHCGVVWWHGERENGRVWIWCMAGLRAWINFGSAWGHR